MTYTNPVGNITNIGDPFILKHQETYYLYATSLVKTGFKVWESANLVEWKLAGVALDRNHPANKWGKGNFYAPEVIFHKGKFYMTYSAISGNGAMKIRVAVSDSPTGPFINWSEPFLPDDKFSYIDGNILIDEENIYLYFVMLDVPDPVSRRKRFQIMVSQLTEDFKGLATHPQVALLPSQKWEKRIVNEGPFAMKHEGIYYLMYSACAYFDPDYAVGYATATSPLGPWTKYQHNPILKKDPKLKVSGPGHNSVTVSPDGKELLVVYHTHTRYSSPGGNRNVCIDKLVFENGVMKILGPTRSAQVLATKVIEEKFEGVNLFNDNATNLV